MASNQAQTMEHEAIKGSRGSGYFSITQEDAPIRVKVKSFNLVFVILHEPMNLLVALGLGLGVFKLHKNSIYSLRFQQPICST